MGFDHILFILSIFLLSSNFKTVLLQCTVFTIAHSISLAMAATGLIFADSKYVEPIIALSIFYTSIENIVGSKLNKWRLLIIFIFGLIHGMGFASALSDIGLPKSNFLTALVSFNIGVELGQISVLVLAWFCFAKWFANKAWYKNKLVYPLSAVLACIALYWLVERL
jgi:hydrogenase/urease accessory protein HupE